MKSTLIICCKFFLKKNTYSCLHLITCILFCLQFNNFLINCTKKDCSCQKKLINLTIKGNNCTIVNDIFDFKKKKENNKILDFYFFTFFPFFFFLKKNWRKCNFTK